MGPMTGMLAGTSGTWPPAAYAVAGDKNSATAAVNARRLAQRDVRIEFKRRTFAYAKTAGMTTRINSTPAITRNRWSGAR